MLGKNNNYLKRLNDGQHVRRFGIRKLTVGVASVTVASMIFLGSNAVLASAEEVSQDIEMAQEGAGDMFEQEPSFDQLQTEPEAETFEQPQVHEPQVEPMVEEESAPAPTGTFFRAADMNAEPMVVAETTGRDISNEITVDAKLTFDDKDGDGKLNAVGGNGLEIESTNFTFDATIPNNAKAGDYFDVTYTPSLSVSPVNPNDVTNGRDPITGIQIGVNDPNTGELIASVPDFRDEYKIRYTLTNYVERYTNVKIKQEYHHNYDYKNTPNSGEYEVGYTIGGKKYADTKYIDYAATAEHLKDEYGVTNQILEIVDNKNYTIISYYNPDNVQLADGATGYIYERHAKDMINPMKMQEAEIKIYEVDQGSTLPDSHYFIPEEVQARDVTTEVNVLKHAKVGYKFTLINPSKTYVAVVKGIAEDVEPGQTRLFATEAALARSSTTIPTSFKNSAIATVAGGATGQGTEKPGSFKENHIYYDKVLNFDGSLKESTENKELSKYGTNIQEGPDSEKYNSSIQPEDYKHTQTTPSTNIPDPKLEEDGSLIGQNFIPGVDQSVTYVYEKEVQPGRFSEEHHYYIIELDEKGVAFGTPIEQTELAKTPAYKEDFADKGGFTSQIKPEDGYEYKDTKTVTENFANETTKDDNGNVNGDYVPGVHQKVIYNYYKEVQVLGAFVDHHKYDEVTKDFFGKEVKRDELEDFASDAVTGRADQTYTT
ncbi:Ig-like domain-containing protein [Dolosicoccus paucivorans]|uniref:Ig-like domain-containing protein n=1 Tax=Dolosicoccus paucivorans TaxID=84521 RepID=UPI000889169D|nr:Ig-like domain-containing protein [Dolosicoccus paucivorans]SDI71326.1 signal peptide-containing protein, YSIRK family [Dolosicoccus paucivorans]